MKIVAFLPVKGTSSRVENKNLKLLDGKPLFLHTLEKLLTCDFIDEVYLDTESEAIIESASHLNHRVLNRDPSLATNKTDGNQLFINEVQTVEADIYIQVLCTSPFIKIETMKKGVDILKSSEFDSVLLVKNEKQYTWLDSKPNYDINKIPNSIDLQKTVIETMGLYIINRESALKYKRRIGNNPYMLEADATEAVDVNWPDEFKLAELIAAGLREKDRVLLDNLKTQLSSSILSDLLDDLGYPTIVNGLTPNINGAKLFGRAKTLKIRKLLDGECYKGIYDALYSYHTIVPNDVIIVVLPTE